jgi:xanthine dehydrogenase accessory factor
MSKRQVIALALAQHGHVVLVSIVETKGSVPREDDAWMLVTPDGFHGSIGGGTLEWKAMAEAQKLLSGGGTKYLDYVLGPDLGQCCGGRVKLKLQRLDAQSVVIDEVEVRRQVLLFGAGHVGRALVLALAPLPFDVQWIDPRPNAFPAVAPINVVMMQVESPTEVLQQANEGCLVFVMTHAHELDLALVDAALRQPNVAHVGLIGSATKRARFEKRFREAGVDAARVAELICPIGVSGISSKHPAAIAAGVVAQILQLDAALASQQIGELGRAQP